MHAGSQVSDPQNSRAPSLKINSPQLIQFILALLQFPFCFQCADLCSYVHADVNKVAQPDTQSESNQHPPGHRPFGRFPVEENQRYRGAVIRAVHQTDDKQDTQQQAQHEPFNIVHDRSILHLRHINGISALANKSALAIKSALANKSALALANKNGMIIDHAAHVSLKVYLPARIPKSTRSRNSLPGLKWGTYLPDRSTFSPVLGLRPDLAAR